MPGRPDVVHAEMQEEAVVVRDLLAALERGALDDARPMLAEELVGFPRVGRGDAVVRGRDAFLERVARLRAEEMRLEIAELEVVKPGYVLATGAASHRGHDYELFVLAEVREGCVRMLESHTSRARAMATIGR